MHDRKRQISSSLSDQGVGVGFLVIFHLLSLPHFVFHGGKRAAGLNPFLHIRRYYDENKMKRSSWKSMMSKGNGRDGWYGGSQSRTEGG